MIEELKEERLLFNLLRQIFLKEPTRELVEGIAGADSPADADDEISYGLKLMIDSVRTNNLDLGDWLEELAIEYARLFIGPKNPPAVPYASFYLSETRSLMADETIDVRKRYLEAGMSVKDLYSIPDDHIGIELEFIYVLTGRIIELFEAEKREEASRLFEIRGDFMRDHMSLWVPFFAGKIIEATGEDFYKGAAYMLKACVG